MPSPPELSRRSPTGRPRAATTRSSPRSGSLDPDRALELHGRLAATPTALGGNAWPDTRGDILVIGGVFGALLGGFGVFLLATACLVVAGATAARMVARRRSLGLLQAIGFRPGRSRSRAGRAPADRCGRGAGGLGGRLARPPAVRRRRRHPRRRRRDLRAAALLVALVLVEAFLAVGVLLPAWRAGRQSPADVLRDVPATPTGGRVVAALARAVGAGPSTVCGIRRAFARPVRAALAGGARGGRRAPSSPPGSCGRSIGRVEDPPLTGDPWDAAAVANSAAPSTIEMPALDDPRGRLLVHRARRRRLRRGHGVQRAGDRRGSAAAAYRIEEGRRWPGPDEAMAGYGFLQANGLAVGDR